MRRKNGTGTIHQKGYIEHNTDGRRILEHRLIAEQALGKPLPKGAIVHHHNEGKQDNTPWNLVVCPNRSYHMMLHRRMQRLKAQEIVDQILNKIKSQASCG